MKSSSNLNRSNGLGSRTTRVANQDEIITGDFPYVKKRKISGSTRSDSGRRARDTFASLKKTCRRLGVNFWEYLQDRVRGLGKVPRLADLIPQKAEEAAARRAPAAPPDPDGGAGV